MNFQSYGIYRNNFKEREGTFRISQSAVFLTLASYFGSLVFNQQFVIFWSKKEKITCFKILPSINHFNLVFCSKNEIKMKLKHIILSFSWNMADSLKSTVRYEVFNCSRNELGQLFELKNIYFSKNNKVNINSKLLIEHLFFKNKVFSLIKQSQFISNLT